MVNDGATVLSSRRRRSVETAEVISSVLGVSCEEPTCDLCEMHAAEGLTQQEIAERFGPNYAFVPGAESWSEFVPRGSERWSGSLGPTTGGR